MGLLSGTWTFSRHRVMGDLPPTFPAFINERIRRYSFAELERSTAEQTLGWTSAEDVLDTAFSYAKYAVGDFLVFALRIDRKTVPPSLLRIRTLAAQNARLTETGRKRLSREENEAIRERVRLEILRAALPVPALFEVCWSVSDKTLYFSSLSPRIMQDFQNLFKESFSLTPCPLLPWEAEFLDADTAERLAAWTRKRGTDAAGDGLASDPALLGREFLTWLWFKSEERDGRITLPDTGDVELHFQRRLVLESGEGEYFSSVTCQGLNADLKEGKEALRQGKKIREARLKLTRDDLTWEFTFKADAFAFQTMKLPATFTEAGEAEDTEEGRTLERIYLIRTGVDLMDQLWAGFFRSRLSPRWTTEEMPRLKTWIGR
ncbi:MAG TPA: recombination-associated protein RdgC [Syntrophales bacterium]|nr:recombination-associated protein RdgC [Syntrophales bacterium]